MESKDKLNMLSLPGREGEVSPQDAQECAPRRNENRCSGAEKQEIVILCPPSMAEPMGKAFALMLSDQQLPATINWSGYSWHVAQGIIVIAWQGRVPGWFLWQLEIDHEIIDFIWYDVPTGLCS